MARDGTGAPTDVDDVNAPTWTTPAPSVLGGRYRVDALLGSGAMGTVYRVHDLELEETVALKMIKSQVDAASLELFRREVRLARRVTHRNVVRTFDIGEHEGAKFLTLEYVDGMSLRRALGQGRLDVDRGLAIAARVCMGLAAIHDASIVHRDLKPDNVLLGHGGEVKVADFGIAFAAGSVGREIGGGTPGYMSPEQVEGRPVDARSDLYALGVLLFELFAGQRPWAGPIAPSDLPPLTRAAPVPAALADIVARCLQRDPSRRPISVASVSSELNELASVAGPTSLAPRSQGWLDPKAITVGVVAWREEGDGALAAALASDLVRELAAFPSLSVRPLLVERKNADVRLDAQAEGVDVIVDGFVRNGGDEISLALRLVTAKDGLLLWGRATRSSPADVLVAISDAAGAIAASLASTSAPARAPVPRDPEAVALYLRAMDISSRSFSELSSESVELLDRALARVPDDPVFLAALAENWSRTFFTEMDGARARVCAERAVLLAPGYSEAYTALAAVLFLANDDVGAVRALVRVLTLTPAAVQARSMLGCVLVAAGRVDEGVAYLRSSYALEPRFDIARFTLARANELIGDTAAADALLVDPPPPSAARVDWMHWLQRARFALTRGDDAYTRALREKVAHPAFEVHPVLFTLRRVLARDGAPGELLFPLIQLSEAFAKRPRARQWMTQLTVEAAAFLGDLEAAEGTLDRAERAGAMVDWLWVERGRGPAALRGRPCFEAIRDRMARTKVATRAEVDVLVPAGSL